MFKTIAAAAIVFASAAFALRNSKFGGSFEEPALLLVMGLLFLLASKLFTVREEPKPEAPGRVEPER